MSIDLDFGEIGSISYPNYVHLISDRGNLSQDTKVTLPSGYEVLKADLVIKTKKHTTKQYIRKITQPSSISIDKDVFIDVRDSIDEAKAEAKVKGKELFGFGKLKSSLSSISLRQVINATTHAEVFVYAWADGREYSSKDGVIIADLEIQVIRLPTTNDVADLITEILKALDESTQEALDAAFQSVDQFGDQTKDLEKTE